MLQKTGGFPELSDLQTGAQTLSPAQLENLGNEVSLFQKVSEWRDLFLMSRTSIPAWQRLTGESGLPIRNKDLLGPLLQKDEVGNLVGDPGAASLQFQYRSEGAGGGELTRYVLLRTLDAKGAALHGAGFGYRADRGLGWLRGPGVDVAPATGSAAAPIR